MRIEKMDSLEKLLFPIIIISKGGKVCYMNEEAMTLFKKSLHLGSDIFSQIPESSLKNFNHFLDSVIRIPTTQECQIEFKINENDKILLQLKGRLSLDGETIQLAPGEVNENKESRFSFKVKYEEIKKVANIGHWELDLKSNDWQYCPKIFEFYEIDPHKIHITPELFYSMIHPEDRDKVTSAFTNSLQEKKIYEVDHRILLSQGRIKWIRETCHWIFDPLENPIGAIGTSQDITKQIELEEKLRSQETNYSNMVENTSCLFWSCDQDGNFTYLNPAWERVLGYKKEEMINRLYSEFQPSDVHVKDQEAYKKFNQTGETVRLGYETIYLTKNGERRYLEFYPNAIFDAQGILIGSHGTAIDLTEKRTLDFKLEETYFELGQRQFAIDKHAIVAITNTDGDIVYINRRFCEISQYSREELIGQNHRIINSGHHTKDFFKELYRTIKKGETWHGEIKNRAKDGSYYWVATTIAPIKNSKGEIEKFISIRTDITQIKEADEKIRLLLEEKALILIEVHHRIKNNMNTIFSLLRMEANQQEISLHKTILLDASTRVRSMMLLYDKLYRSENKDIISIREYFPVLISEIINIFPNNTMIKTFIEVEPVLVSAKILSTIGIIINELITNSMKYSFSERSEGKINFLAKKDYDKLILTYQDNGKPMEEEIDLKKTNSFGLNLIQMLIQQLDGTVHMDRKDGNCYIMEFHVKGS